MDLTSKKVNEDAQQNTQTISNNEDGIIVENQLNVNQFISRKAKDAERSGDVINISLYNMIFLPLHINRNRLRKRYHTESITS